MPAQHGSSSVLTRMHRGYTREAYLALVSRARRIIAGSSSIGDVDADAAVAGIGLGLSSDFIAGFCGETEEEHREHLSLLTQVHAQKFSHKLLYVCSILFFIVVIRYCH